jgi:hypothetical protein
MKDPNTILGILNIAVGILFILISIPLVIKKIPMNSLYGFRISKAFESEENWYEVNRYGGRQLIQWSLLLIVIGALYFTFPMDSSRSELTNALMAVAPIIICPVVAIVKTVLYAKQM